MLAFGGSRPMSARIAVVLPQPDSPTSPKRSPRASSNEIPLTAWSSAPLFSSNQTQVLDAEDRLAHFLPFRRESRRRLGGGVGGWGFEGRSASGSAARTGARLPDAGSAPPRSTTRSSSARARRPPRRRPEARSSTRRRSGSRRPKEFSIRRPQEIRLGSPSSRNVMNVSAKIAAATRSTVFATRSGAIWGRMCLPIRRMFFAPRARAPNVDALPGS